MPTVAKNTAYMMFASVAQKIISFVYFTIIARLIGVELTGKYFLALSFTTIFAVLTDFGLGPALNREVARKPEAASRFLGTVLSIKLLLMVGTYTLLIVAAHALDYPAETLELIYLSGLTMLFDSVNLSFYMILRGFQNLKYESFGMVMSQFGTMVIGTIALVLQLPLIWLMIAFVIPSFCNMLYAGTIVMRKFHIVPRMGFDRPLVKMFLRIAFPFALAGLFARVYSYSDTIFLSKLAGDQAVGWYSIPNKITFAFQFIPLSLAAALYPRMSEAFVHDKERLRYLFNTAMKYLVIVALPVAIGIGVLARDVVVSLYTIQYLPSVLPMQILLASLIFAFIDFPVGSLLNSSNKQHIQTTAMGVAMVVNILVNIFLIPLWGIVGAAVAALVSNIVLFVGGYLFVERVIHPAYARFIGLFLSALLIAGLMGIAVWLLKLLIPWYLTIPIGIILYGTGLLLARIVTMDEINQFRQRIFNRLDV